MIIKQDPITGLWCREDGAVLMPPSTRSRAYQWTFGSRSNGYCVFYYQGEHYRAHILICRAFNGLPPEGKPFCDHINRVRDDNRPSNLRWVDRSENRANAADVDRSIEKYGVRECEDRAAYRRGVYKCNEASRQSQIARVRKWQQNNKEKVNAAAHARYAIKRAKKEGESANQTRKPRR